MQFTCERILSAVAEERGKNIILVMKYNKENQAYLSQITATQ